MKITHALLALIVVSAVTARGQVVTPNPPPTIITTAPYTINSPGFYQLGANLTVTSTTGAIITINASNVTLDFAGHYISGPANNPAATLYGVFANERGNVNIQNGTITYCEVGVYLEGNGTGTSININQRIQNMLISYCSYIGVDLYNANNCDVLNNRISFIGGSSLASYGYGVYVRGTGVKVSNNEVTAVTAGANQPNPETPGFGYGIFGSTSTFSVANTLTSCDITIYGGKYANNLTYPTAAPAGGTDAGGNN